MFDFSTLERPKAPNTALAADPGDTASPPDRPAPRFAASPADVMAAWDRMVRSEPRTTVVATGPVDHSVQRSRVLRLPDDIHAQVRPAGAGARMLVYSASRYGKGDLGVNGRRLRRWVARLEADLRP